MRFVGRLVALQQTVLPPTTILRGSVNPGFSAFFLARSWTDDYKVNGVLVEEPSLLLFHDEFTRVATDLDTLAFGFRREPIEAAALALAGVQAKGRRLGTEAVHGPVTELAALQNQMTRLAECAHLRPATLESSEGRALHERALVTETVGLLAKLYESPWNSSRLDASRYKIVRRAEERFEAAGESTVSLADLCQAAGVSARTLQYAFRDTYEMTPLQYFKVRRLHRAHRSLKAATPERGAVKRAALSAGLTELGRFSVEYRALFGKSPSATLTEN